MVRRRLLAILMGAATTVTAAAGGAYGGDIAPTGPLAAEMAAALAQQPGGVQVSDNAMAWDGGAVVVVWPNPGDAAAPAGLGSGVRHEVADVLGLQVEPQRRVDVSARGSASTCASGLYCFYTASNFGGSRYEYGTTCSASAGGSGLNDNASSWVNRNSSRTYHAYDYLGGPRLWSMAPGTSDSYVGAAADNRMGYWSCTS